MSRADHDRLAHVLDAIDRIDRYATERSALDDEKTADAVIRCVTVVGEALGAVSPDTYQQLPSLPPHLPRGQRNVLVHEYWRVDLDLVWATVQRLPALRRDIEAVLQEQR